MILPCVYILRNTAVDYPAYYVGKTKHLKRRMFEHSRALSNTYFAKAVRKYGWDAFELCELTNYPSEQEALDSEAKRIEELKSAGLHLYNILAGGGMDSFSRTEIRSILKSLCGSRGPGCFLAALDLFGLFWAHATKARELLGPGAFFWLLGDLADYAYPGDEDYASEVVIMAHDKMREYSMSLCYKRQQSILNLPTAAPTDRIRLCPDRDYSKIFGVARWFLFTKSPPNVATPP